VHKFEELVDDRLEELPVGLEKARVLADNVHDVGGDDGLVVLAALHFGQAEELLNDVDEEALLVFLVCAPSSALKFVTQTGTGVLIAPDMDPIAQHRVLRLPHDHSLPSICRASLSVMMVSVSTTSRWVR
jgi:hypothetical protein